MSDKPFDKISPLDRLIRQTARCGMTEGTVMVIEFISGFELFNTRAYHNYETWSQGWRVHGFGVISEREDLDDAVAEWAKAVNDLRDGKAIAPHLQMSIVCRHPRRPPMTVGETLPDWIVPRTSQDATQ